MWKRWKGRLKREPTNNRGSYDGKKEGRSDYSCREGKMKHERKQQHKGRKKPMKDKRM